MNNLFFVIVYFAISSVQGFNALADDIPDRVLAVFEKVNEVCGDSRLPEDCGTLIQMMRSEERYQDPAIQYVISEALLSVSGNRPELLETASEILDDLIAADPKNRRYQQQRIVIRTYGDNLGAICEAQQAGYAGLLSGLLLRYLLTKQIERDIVATAIQKFDMNIAEGQEIGAVLTEAQMTLEKIGDYGSEAQSAGFMAHMKKTIPWDSWRQDRWSLVVASMKLPSAQEASTILYAHCHQLMVAFDNGEFCKQAVELIGENADDHMLSDPTLQMMIKTISSRFEEDRPGMAGDTQDVLKGMIDRMDQ